MGPLLGSPTPARTASAEPGPAPSSQDAEGSPLSRPVVLVAGARFGLLLGLGVWVGVALAALALAPVVYARLERANADELAAALFERVDRLLLAALALLVVALGTQAVLNRAVPPGSLLLPLAGMAGSRLVAAFAVGPGLRALRGRLRDAHAPAHEAERRAHSRLQGAWILLLTLEVCLGLYGLFAAS